MKAKDGVLGYLNKTVTLELTAIHQYLLHAALCDRWGYADLHRHFHGLASEEMSHVSSVIEHILYLEGTPDVQRLGTVEGGRDVAELFAVDLALETDDLKLLREAVAHCAKVGDFTTRRKLEEMVVETEEHIDWFEIQQRAIRQIGLERYLSERIQNEGT